FSILLMYLIGGIPLGIYLGLIFYPGSTQSWFYQWLSIFAGTVVSFLSILSPFLLAIASIKLVAELSPRSFAKFCTIFLRKKTMLQHVVVRNIASKSKSVSKIMLIVSFTIAFSLMISISDRSLSYYNIEKSQLALGSDIKVKFSMDRDMINSTMNTLLKNATFETNTTAQRGENITAMAFKISKNGQIQGQSNNQFQYNSFMFHCMNMTDYLKVTRAIQKDKFLSGVTWAELRNTLESNSSDNIALLPVEFQDAVEETTFTLVFTFWDENWTESIEYTKEFRIAGFFKAFPGIQEYEDWIIRPMQFFPMGYPVIVNLDFTKVFSQVENIYESFDFQVSIDTILNKQEDIDNFARLLNFTGHLACTGYETMSNMTEQSGFTGFNPINSPAFFGLLRIDYWFLLIISIFGLTILVFQRITAERREIGLFRIRGFTSSMIYKIQASEKYMPILIGALIGVLMGILAGILMTYVIAFTAFFRFIPFNPKINYYVDIIFHWSDITLLIVIPIISYFLITMLAIRREVRQSLGSIMSEED
ncbi:MAG: FtsX-like permease family protein, partial [Promethearchaeota archaeon]